VLQLLSGEYSLGVKMGYNLGYLSLAAIAELVLLLVSPTYAQTTINGNSLAYQSTGSSSSSAWTLDRNGYVGTYITLSAPGSVTVKVNADGTASSGINPHMGVAIADTLAGFDVSSGAHDYSHTYSLPAGTFFVRTQFDNDLDVTPRQLKINNLTITGATVSNAATAANALAASDSYIAGYRKGNVTINLAGLGLPTGSTIGVSMKRLAFNWGTAIPSSGLNIDNYIGSDGTAQQTNYQAKLLQNFNAVTLENAGKWNDTEGTRNEPDMRGVDAYLDYAQAHGLYARMHNEISDNTDANPAWVNTLQTSAAAGSVADKNDLRSAITSRTGYYLSPARAAKIGEVDIYNESYEGVCCLGSPDRSNWNLFGASGVAGIYHEAKVNQQTKLFTNEYKALIYDSDGKPNGYFDQIQQLMQAGKVAGYPQVLDGIGTEDYPWDIGMHSPSDIVKALQMYSVTGLPQTLTEFGVFAGVSPTDAATILSDTMRLEFGNPLGTGFFMWGFHVGNGDDLFAPAAALYTVANGDWNNWTITPAGQAWQDKLGIQDWDGNTANGWTTQLTQSLSANGTINFDGYYGDYEITAGGKKYTLSLKKGTSSYTIGGLPGDFNGDGKVDAADYLVWRKTDGSSAGYNLWRTNFGKTLGSGAGTSANVAVPEPTTLVLLFMGMFVMLSRRRMRVL
jgi:GH35 family endo-1,4-beta-xylanase